MFLRKSTQNTPEPILQWVKDATSSNCEHLLVILKMYLAQFGHAPGGKKNFSFC